MLDIDSTNNLKGGSRSDYYTRQRQSQPQSQSQSQIQQVYPVIIRASIVNQINNKSTNSNPYIRKFREHTIELLKLLYQDPKLPDILRNEFDKHLKENNLDLLKGLDEIEGDIREATDIKTETKESEVKSEDKGKEGEGILTQIKGFLPQRAQDYGCISLPIFA